MNLIRREESPGFLSAAFNRYMQTVSCAIAVPTESDLLFVYQNMSRRRSRNDEDVIAVRKTTLRPLQAKAGILPDIVASDSGAKQFRNKERVLVVSSRGITSR